MTYLHMYIDGNTVNYKTVSHNFYRFKVWWGLFILARLITVGISVMTLW